MSTMNIKAQSELVSEQVIHLDLGALELEQVDTIKVVLHLSDRRHRTVVVSRHAIDSGDSRVASW